MSDIERHVVRCARGHEIVITSETLKPMLDVNRRGTAFVLRCPLVEDGTVCGAPAQITQKEVSRLLGMEQRDVKQMMKDMHAQKTGAGPVAPLQPPEPQEPSEPQQVQVLKSDRPPILPVSRLTSRDLPPRPEPPRPHIPDDDMVDPAMAIREERPVLKRKFPPIRVVENKEPLEVLKEIINESGLKDDVTYTLHRIADLMDDAWTTDDFVLAAKQYGVSDAIAKGVSMRFKLEWKSHLKQLEEQQRVIERTSGPSMGPFARSGPASTDPMISPQAPQFQQMAQQIGMQMLQGNPVMQMWAQSNPRDFDDMVRKVVEQTLRSQQSMGQPGPGMGMHPLMTGQYFPFGYPNMMNPMMNPMMGGIPSAYTTPPVSRRESVSEERVKELIESSVSSAMNDIKVVLAQMSAQQQTGYQPREDPLMKQIVLTLMQNQQGQNREDPLVGKLLEHVLASSSERGEVTEQLLLQMLGELKKGQDSRSMDLDELRELINLKSIEGELGLKQREFDDRRENRELMRDALNEGLTVVGSAIASTMMSRGMGGAPMTQADQEPVPTEMLQTDDGSILMSCRGCGKPIMAPPDAIEIICPFCNAQFPVVDAPQFEPITPGGKDDVGEEETIKPEEVEEDYTESDGGNEET